MNIFNGLLTFLVCTFGFGTARQTGVPTAKIAAIANAIQEYIDDEVMHKVQETVENVMASRIQEAVQDALISADGAMASRLTQLEMTVASLETKYAQLYRRVQGKTQCDPCPNIAQINMTVETQGSALTNIAQQTNVLAATQAQHETALQQLEMLTSRSLEEVHQNMSLIMDRVSNIENCSCLQADTPRSCKEHMDNANGQPMVDGVYGILHSGKMLNVYCDMTTDGGGWMLLVSNTARGRNWTLGNIRERNIASAGLHIEYSILRIADEIRKKSSASYFEYRLEATGRGRWGGIWRAPAGYTLLDETASQTNIVEMTKFDSYRYHDSGSIGYRVPWIDVKHISALLTTKRFDAGGWWGTLVMKESAPDYDWKGHGPAPWIASSYNSEGTRKHKVSPIYYWFRMD